MKIAVTATGPSLDDHVEPRFGRCAYFLIVDTDSTEFEAMENPNTALGGGAGIQSAQLMAEKGVQAVLTGNCGPNAFQVFGAAGVQVITGVSGRARDAIGQFKAGAFAASSEANVASHFGMGGSGSGGGLGMGGGMGGGRGMGRGMGGGMGGGRGMGRGMGGGMGGGMGAGMMGAPQAAPYSTPPGIPPQPDAQTAPDQELEMLKAQAQAMTEQLNAINARIGGFQQRAGTSVLTAVVDPDRCSGCGICQGVCPTGAVVVDKVARINSEKCTGCGQCVAECPEDALSLRKA